MANIKSQVKRNRQNEKRRVRNQSARSELKTRVKVATLGEQRRVVARLQARFTRSALELARPPREPADVRDVDRRTIDLGVRALVRLHLAHRRILVAVVRGGGSELLLVALCALRGLRGHKAEERQR